MYKGRGNAKYAKQDLDGAIADYDRAIALNPNGADAYYNRGLAKRTKQDLDGAIADFDRAIALNPNDPDAYYNRGNAKRAKEDLDGAIADYGRTIALDPNYAPAYNNRGKAKDIRGDFDGARADYEKYIAIGPKGSDYARFRLALVLRRQHADESPAGLAAAVATWDNGWTKTVGLFVTGVTAESDFLNQAAVGDAKTVTNQQCEAYYYAGMARLLKGDTAKAGELFHKCIATGVTSFVEFSLANAELARIR